VVSLDAKPIIRQEVDRGLAIAQKNTAELGATGRAGFDLAIAEECYANRECGEYTRPYGRRVIQRRNRCREAVACQAERWSVRLGRFGSPQSKLPMDVPTSCTRLNSGEGAMPNTIVASAASTATNAIWGCAAASASGDHPATRFT